jgi:uncharacterized lipoprotein YddW (UPF0748 family)
VWVDRSTLATRESIERMMESLAAANMNAVYVNVWSRGYPLWQSDVFEAETGIRIDPAYGDRDPLQECAQEYPAWVREGSVDFITPQLYYSTAEQYERELARQLAQPGAEPSRFVAGIDITNSRNAEVLIRMIEHSRSQKLAGVVIWYYAPLAQLGVLERLRETVYAERTSLPWR